VEGFTLGYLAHTDGTRATKESITHLLTQEKLTIRHTLTKAGDRGTSVHDAFEDWAVNGTIPQPEIYPETERPYVLGLCKFLSALMFGKGSTLLAEIDAEVMVGSLQHLYAGRYDMRCRWTGGPMVTRTYPKRANKVEELPAGRYMLDPQDFERRLPVSRTPACGLRGCVR